MARAFGEQLPRIVTVPPGPESRRLGRVLSAYESPNVTFVSDRFPIFWEAARGANVRDVDGNVFVDLTAAFAVAVAGHGHPTIVEAVREQAGRLLHGMGDVHPPAVKARILERLAEITPGPLKRTILASSGAEAVEAALKTVALATGKPRVLAFHGSYHGLTYGALAVTGREDFQAPFRAQLPPIGVFADFPGAAGRAESAEEALAGVEAALDGEEGEEVGAILVEPVQGRGGDVVPPDGWLPGLRRICDARGLLLVADEIYTGFGRTGKWFACEHWGVVPDLLVVGKALTGGLPFAACIGTDYAMSGWPRSAGEALHTSTFLGHPLGCAAALASIEVIESERLVERAEREGAYLLEALRAHLASNPRVGEVRGLGMMIGIEVADDRDSGEPGAAGVGAAVVEALRAGFLILGGGVHGNVVSLSPPLTITREQLDAAVGMLGSLSFRPPSPP